MSEKNTKESNNPRVYNPDEAKFLIEPVKYNMRISQWACILIVIVSIIALAPRYNLYFSYQRDFFMKLKDDQLKAIKNDNMQHFNVAIKADSVFLLKKNSKQELLMLFDTLQRYTNKSHTQLGANFAIDVRKTQKDTLNLVPSMAQKYLLEQWISSTFVNIPILGIKIHASDSSGIIAITFLLLIWWVTFACRKEHFSIVTILQRLEHPRCYYADADIKKDKDNVLGIHFRELQRNVYHGLTAYNVLFPSTKRDNPIWDLNKTKLFCNINSNNECFENHKVVRNDDDEVSNMRKFSNFIFFLPAIVTLLVAFMEIYSLGLPSIFRFEDQAIYTLLNNGNNLLESLIIHAVIPFIIGLACLRLGYKSYKYQRATNKILKDFRDTYIMNCGAVKTGIKI